MKRSWVAALAFALILFLPIQGQAQDDLTETPIVLETPAAPPIVVEDGGTVIIEGDEAPSEDGGTTINVSTVLGILAGILMALAAGGGFAVIWTRIRNDKQVKDNAEMLFSGLSPEWKDVIQSTAKSGEQIARIALEIAAFLKEVTDGLPNTEAQARAAARDEVNKIDAEKAIAETPPATEG